jgi:PQ loop repeat
MGGIQAALVVSLGIAKSHHVDWPMTFMAVLSATLLAAGVLTHYWDIWKHRTVRGISFIFVGIDAGGDLFSLISIIFQPSLDVVGMAIYGTELLLWLGVFACGGYFNFVPWIRPKLMRTGQERPRKHETSSGGVDQPDHQRQCTQQLANAVMLRDMPSSTSVFRTSSGSVTGARERSSAVSQQIQD